MNSVVTVVIIAIAATATLQCRADFIDDMCSQTPYPQTCKSAVRSDPRSKTATNAAKLGSVVVDKLADNLKKEVAKIKGLIRSVRDRRVKAALTVCANDLTGDILGSLIDSARQAFSYGNPKFAEDAMNASNEIITEECEARFHGRSPIEAENTVAKELSAVGAALARMLL